MSPTHWVLIELKLQMELGPKFKIINDNKKQVLWFI